MNRSGGISRRQFLLLSGGGAAALWVAHAPAAQALRRGPLTQLLPDSISAPHLRALPFTDDFSDMALHEWNVRRAVSVLGTTPFGAALPGTQALDSAAFLRDRGTVLALDGPLAESTGPGLIETVDTFVFDAGATYALVFAVAGSHVSADRMPLSSMTASLPGLGLSKSVTRMPQDDFLEFRLEVPRRPAGLSTIVIASGNAPGQAGVLLESLSLTRTG